MRKLATKRPRAPWVIAAIVVTAATAVAILAETPPPTRADTPAYMDRFMPLAMVAFEAPFATAITAPPPTATRPRPTDTPRPTLTPSPTPTIGPSLTPTPLGGIVDHPTDPETILFQIGWTDTDQKGAAWEEMNGTPFFTLYGDGRVIGGPALFDWRQTLFEGQVGEDQIQAWLRALTHDIGFFTLEPRYNAPDSRKYAVHVYARYGAGDDEWERVSLGGFTRWLTVPGDPGTEEARVKALARWVKDIEASDRAQLSQPYTVAEYTVISHEVNPILAGPPAWKHALDIAAISDRAPIDPEGGNKHGPPGHDFVDATLGRAIWDIVTVDARRDSAGYNQATEYAYRGRRFVVGARQEVPGESPFIPDATRGHWYRQDE